MNRKWIIVVVLVAGMVAVLSTPGWVWKGNQSLQEINELRNRAAGTTDQKDVDPVVTIPPELIPFVNLRDPNEDVAREALLGIAENWKNSYAVMLLELRGIVENPRVSEHLLKLIQEKTKRPPNDMVAIYRWIWGPTVKEHPRYADFKSLLYNGIDTRFRKVFSPRPETRVDLRELLFNGSHEDRLLSIQSPKMVTKDKADELRDGNSVVGIVVDGVAKAYPRQMLAHHEVVKDQIGDSKILLVDCILSGTVTAFSSADHSLMEFFSSGFIYRGHKVLMDPQTSTLWSAATGECIVGPETAPLVRHPVVITTWKDWKARHPDSWILNPKKPRLGSREIDYTRLSPRDRYLDNDVIGAPVPEVTPLLKNKTDVLVIPKQPPVAIAIDYRKKKPLFQLDNLVVLSTSAGASRVYLADKFRFKSWDQRLSVTDSNGGKWQVTEQALVGPNKESCPRVVSYHTFWFAWNVLNPAGQLVK